MYSPSTAINTGCRCRARSACPSRRVGTGTVATREASSPIASCEAQGLSGVLARAGVVSRVEATPMTMLVRPMCTSLSVYGRQGYDIGDFRYLGRKGGTNRYSGTLRGDIDDTPRIAKDRASSRPGTRSRGQRQGHAAAVLRSPGRGTSGWAGPSGFTLPPLMTPAITKTALYEAMGQVRPSMPPAQTSLATR